MKPIVLATSCLALMASCAFDEGQASAPDGDDAGVDAAAVSDAAVDGPLFPDCQPYLLASDDFEDGQRNSQWADLSANGAQAVESNGELNVTLGDVPSFRFAGYRSARSDLSLTGHRMSIRLSTLVSTSTESQAAIEFGGDHGRYYQVRIHSEQIAFFFSDENNNLTSVGSANYSSTDHQFIQLRESAGMIHLEAASADGGWVSIATDALDSSLKIYAVNSGRLRFYGRNLSTQADDSSIRFDDYNLASGCGG